MSMENATTIVGRLIGIPPESGPHTFEQLCRQRNVDPSSIQDPMKWLSTRRDYYSAVPGYKLTVQRFKIAQIELKLRTVI